MWSNATALARIADDHVGAPQPSGLGLDEGADDAAHVAAIELADDRGRDVFNQHQLGRPVAADAFRARDAYGKPAGVLRLE